MSRSSGAGAPLGVALLLGGAALAAAAVLVQQLGLEAAPWLGDGGRRTLVTVLAAGAIVLGATGVYRLLLAALLRRTESKRRRHDVRNLLRLGVGIAATVALLGLLTEQWFGVLVSLGIVGVAITFALQQPLFSVIGWLYIVTKHPYGVGDRVAIDDARGDVIEVDFLVTTLWEIDGGLVSSNQPSGRVITVPNSVVLSSTVFNFTREEFPFVWNELTVQVAYETDLAFATGEMAAIADDYLGDRMAARIERYRSRLAETPVELEVQERPSVNVVQEQSWVELRLRYLVDPRRGQRVRNELYRRILSRFNEEPERVRFPIGRNR